MKNDSTTTLLNFVLAVLVILGVVFALLSMNRVRTLRQITPRLQLEAQQVQIGSAKAQALLNDVISYNATARSPELAEIIKIAQTPAQPAAK
jgi:cell division protein FtsX